MGLTGFILAGRVSCNKCLLELRTLALEREGGGTRRRRGGKDLLDKLKGARAVRLLGDVALERSFCWW